MLVELRWCFRCSQLKMKLQTTLLETLRNGPGTFCQKSGNNLFGKKISSAKCPQPCRKEIRSISHFLMMSKIDTKEIIFSKDSSGDVEIFL